MMRHYFLQIPNEMKGKMTIEIISGASGHSSTLHLHSNSGNALYITERKVIYILSVITVCFLSLI